MWGCALSLFGKQPRKHFEPLQPQHPTKELQHSKTQAQVGHKGVSIPREMIPYMDYVQNAFYEATEWNQDNSYATLTATARGLSIPILEFEVT